MKIIEINSFKHVLFITTNDVFANSLNHFKSMESLFRQGFHIEKVTTIENVNEEIYDTILNKYNKNLYLNYKKQFFESDQFSNPKDSFKSFLNYHKLDKQDNKFVIILKRLYIRVPMPNGEYLTFVNAYNARSDAKIKQIKKPTGVNTLIFQIARKPFEIQIPFDFETLDFFDVIEGDYLYQRYMIAPKNTKNGFDAYIKNKIKFAGKMLIIKDKD